MVKIGLYDDCPLEEVARKTRELPAAIGAPIEIYIMQRSMDLVDCHLCGTRMPGLMMVTDNDCLEGVEIGGDMAATIFCTERCRYNHEHIGHNCEHDWKHVAGQIGMTTYECARCGASEERP